MANLITQKEFDQIKNQKFTVIAFKEGRRVVTMCGYNALAVLKYIMQVNGRDITVIVLPDGVLGKGEFDWNLQYYRDNYGDQLDAARNFINTRY